MAVEWGTLAIVLAVAFLPPLLFLAWVRSAERHGREPWHALLRAFAWGALGAVLLSLLGEQALLWYHGSDLRRPTQLEDVFALPRTFFLVVVAAPFIEEIAKAWGLRGVRRQVKEVEDGIVYGAAIGLGFSATENLVYELATLVQDGEAAFWVTAGVRTVSTTFLHASTAGLVGYGYAHAVTEGRPMAWLFALPFLALAMLLHAAFNVLASTNELWALIAVLVLAPILILVVRNRIRHLDQHKRHRRGGFFTP